MSEKISFADVQVSVLVKAHEQGNFPWATRMSVEEDLLKTFQATAYEVAQAINLALKYKRAVSDGRFLAVQKKGTFLPPPPKNSEIDRLRV